MAFGLGGRDGQKDEKKARKKQKKKNDFAGGRGDGSRPTGRQRKKKAKLYGRKKIKKLRIEGSPGVQKKSKGGGELIRAGLGCLTPPEGKKRSPRGKIPMHSSKTGRSNSKGREGGE